MDWLTNFVEGIKRNYSKQTCTERVYWSIICISIIFFGAYVKLFWLSLFISTVVVFLGIVALKNNKNMILMIATFLFAVATFYEQNKRFVAQLNTQADSLQRQIENLNLSKKDIELRYTPDIRTYLTCKGIYEGTRNLANYGRVDDYIVIPIVIYNRTYGYAKDITLAMQYNYGFEDKTLQREIPLIKGGDSYNDGGRLGFSPSLDPEFRELFLNKKRSFKIKIILTWKDASGKNYKAAEDFILVSEKEGLDTQISFIFKSEGFFSSIDRVIKEVEAFANKKISTAN